MKNDTVTKVTMVYLHFHWISVNLAHVLSPVLPLHPSDIECPRVVVIVCNTQAGIVRDHVLVDC